MSSEKEAHEVISDLVGYMFTQHGPAGQWLREVWKQKQENILSNSTNYL